MYALNGFTAKHRVLLNLDLLSYIVQLISGRHSTASTETVYDDRRTLTKLVRVSKLFLDPALNELWWSLNNLTPVSTLYETLLSKTQNETDRRTCLERLYFYTKRVREVRYHDMNNDFSNITFQDDLSVVHKLYPLCKGSPLFPSLHQLITDVWPLSAAESDVLFSPTLQVIQARAMLRYSPIHGKDVERPPSRVWKLRPIQQSQMCTQRLVKRCPKLLRLVRSQGTMHLLDLVFNLEHLNEIDVSFPQSLTVNKKLEYLQKASWMNKLESLGCALLECPDAAFSTLELGSFSQLRTIQIEGSVPSLLCLFRAMSSPLASVNITTDIGDNWLGFRQCLHFLAVNSGKDVTTFTLRRPGRGPAPFIPSFSNIYPPLLNMPSIRSVEINMPFLIIDDDITQLAKAWANLRSIRIRQPPVDLSARPGFGAQDSVHTSVWWSTVHLFIRS